MEMISKSTTYITIEEAEIFAMIEKAVKQYYGTNIEKAEVRLNNIALRRDSLSDICKIKLEKRLW